VCNLLVAGRNGGVRSNISRVGHIDDRCSARWAAFFERNFCAFESFLLEFGCFGRSPSLGGTKACERGRRGSLKTKGYRKKGKKTRQLSSWCFWSLAGGCLDYPVERQFFVPVSFCPMCACGWWRFLWLWLSNGWCHCLCSYNTKVWCAESWRQSSFG